MFAHTLDLRYGPVIGASDTDVQPPARSQVGVRRGRPAPAREPAGRRWLRDRARQSEHETRAKRGEVPAADRL